MILNRHYPSPWGDNALNVQHRDFWSSHSECLHCGEGAQPEVAISQSKAKKMSRDKERITKFRMNKQEEALAQQYGSETFGPAYHGPHEDIGPHFYEAPIPEGRTLMEYTTDQPPILPEHFSVPVQGSREPATQAAAPPEIPPQGILPSQLPPGTVITPVIVTQPTAQAPNTNLEEPPAQVPAWLASFTYVLTGLSNRLQFASADQPPHPPHYSPPPPVDTETEAEQLTSPDDGIDVQSPQDNNNNNIQKKFSKSLKRSDRSRSNIKLTQDADMSEDNSEDVGSDVSEHTPCS